MLEELPPSATTPRRVGRTALLAIVLTIAGILAPIGYVVRSAYQAVPFGSGRMLRTQFFHSPDEGEGFGFRTIRTAGNLELAFDAGGDRYSCLFNTFTYRHTFARPQAGPKPAKWPAKRVWQSELAKKLRFKPLIPSAASPFGLRDHELNWVNLNSVTTINGVTLTSGSYRARQALCSKIYVKEALMGYLVQTPSAPALETRPHIMAIVEKGYFTVDSGVGTTWGVGTAKGIDYVILSRTMTSQDRTGLRRALGDHEH